MKKYLYEGHTGYLYIDESDLDQEDLYCEVCGDYDIQIGSFETVKELWNLLCNLPSGLSVGGYGGWSLEYVFPMIVSEFELDCNVTYEDEHMKLRGLCSNTEEDILEQLRPYIEEESKELTFFQFVEAVRSKQKYCEHAENCEDSCLTTCFECKHNILRKSKS